MKTKQLLLAAAFSFCLCSMQAQTNQVSNTTPVSPDRECKTTVTQTAIDMEAERDQAAYRQLLQQHMTPESNVLTEFTVQIHIVRDDAGNGGIPIATVRNEFTNWVNPYFAAINVSFRECAPPNYINSSAYYNLSGDAEGDAMSVANNVANVINIYFVNDPDDACGWARFPWMLPSDYIVIANSCADNQSTLVHELGHYFSLYHTHETAFGRESVTRSNADACYDCDNQGDLLCDTEADPTLNSGSVSISAPPGCVYSSSLTDTCGVSYTPNTNSIMSYSEKACRTIFTAQQKAKMTLTIASPPGSPLFGRNYLQTTCPCDLPTAVCKNITVNLDATGNATITPADVDNGSTYDCGLDTWTVSPNSFDCSDKGANVVTLTITDDIGWVVTCQSTVTINDVTNPTISTPAVNETVECDGSGNIGQYNAWLAANGGASASDECGGSWSSNLILTTPGCGNTETRYVTFTFTDPSNNSASTLGSFTIEDKTAPAFECPSNIHLPECVETASWSVLASDACGNVTVVSVPPSGSVFPKGTTTNVSVTATDECGNSSNCVFTVTRDPDLTVTSAPIATSSLNTCALGTGANIVLGYGGGPTCPNVERNCSRWSWAIYYAWTKPAAVPATHFTNANTANPTFCASFQTAACAVYTFVVTATDFHGCTETLEVSVSVINPTCGNKDNKVGVCHRPPGNIPNESTQCLSPNAVNTHLTGHPDCLGGCNDVCLDFNPRYQSPDALVDENISPYIVTVMPNPFDYRTTIRIQSNHPTKAKLTIIDNLGRILAIPFNGSIEGDVPTHVDFDASLLPAGIYIARLIGEDGMSTQQTMIIVK